MKETFIVRSEWFEAISELTDEQQAQIFRNLFNFHNGNENLINLNNLFVKLVWKLIEPNLIRNSESYDKRKQTSSENGKKGGRPPKQPQEPNNNLNKPIQSDTETKEPIESLSVSVSDSVSVSVSDSVIVPPSNFSPLLEEYGNLTALEAKERYLNRNDYQYSIEQLAMAKRTTVENIKNWVSKFTEVLIAQSWKNSMSEWLKYFGNWFHKNYKSEADLLDEKVSKSKTLSNLTAAEKAKQATRNELRSN